MESNRPPVDMDKLISIRIEGIDNNVTKEDFNRIFREYGEIADIYIPRDRHSGGNRGFCFVRYFNEDDARKALVENGKTLNGREMSITMAEKRPPRRERRRYSRSRSRSYGSRRRRYSRSRSRSHSSRRHHSHHRSSHRSHRSSRRDSRSRSYSRSASHHSNKGRTRSRSRSLSHENKLSE